ncbi:MAG: LysM peptidoglycan-binding domain-containing protein, partial [Alphaproteobacteria bacterium]|nr:LysM peptidoglycan-binding domain-containing protein [Alphaproteobacteria bacterium]
MRIWLKSLLIFALIFSATCSKKKPARIVNRGHVVYGKNGKISKTKKAHEFKQVEIEKGDTLHSVAKKNQISVRELVNENRLDPPYEIKVG